MSAARKPLKGPGGRAEKGGGNVWLNPTACVLSFVAVLGACSACSQIEQRGQVSAPPANAATSTPDPKGPVNVVTEHPRPTQAIPLLTATATQGLTRQVWTLQEVVDNGAAVIVAVTLKPCGSDIRGATVDQAPNQVVLAGWSKTTAVPARCLLHAAARYCHHAGTPEPPLGHPSGFNAAPEARASGRSVR